MEVDAHKDAESLCGFLKAIGLLSGRAGTKEELESWLVRVTLYHVPGPVSSP